MDVFGRCISGDGGRTWHQGAATRAQGITGGAPVGRAKLHLWSYVHQKCDVYRTNGQSTLLKIPQISKPIFPDNGEI